MFTSKIKSLTDGEILLREIENTILENPSYGDIIAGTGGVRKARFSSPARRKGKRGGYRLLYLDLPDMEHTHLIYIYGKDERDDISAEGIKIIRKLVSQIKEQAHE